LENGKIEGEWSVSQILLDNGFLGILYGVGEYESDRIHLNSVREINFSDDFEEKGDLILSARNISSVFLYRPSSNKVIWLKTSPFLNQHDVQYLGNGEFSIFGNDNVRIDLLGSPRAVAKNNSIWIYDMKTEKIYPYLTLSSSVNAQGRQKFLQFYFQISAIDDI